LRTVLGAAEKSGETMKSIHPPLYILVASIAFFLGAKLDLSDAANSSDVRDRTAFTLESQNANPQASNKVGSTIESNGSLEQPSTNQDELALNRVADDDSGVAKSVEKRQPQRAPVLKTKFGNVEIFPVDNPWNQEISQAKVHPDSDTWIKSIGLSRGLHPDFGTVWNGAPNGIPYLVVGPDQPKVPVSFMYEDESDAGPYPIPMNAPIEGGPRADDDTDRHVIVIDAQRKLLYELFHAYPLRGGWKAGSGAVFDLSTNKMRPLGWTSADAAGLPIFPGLIRYDEVAAGEIRHALRFTVRRTQRGYIYPARHFASRSTDRKLPPMGLRVRLRSDFDLSGYPKTARVILTALKKYGMLLADNGSDWFVSGAPDARWSDDDLATIKRIKGRDLECVITGPITRAGASN
jgi:hypothetical protein